MSTDRILILGGYGNTGLSLSRLLLSETSVSLTLAGRDLHKAQTVASSLNTRFKGTRVTSTCVDASQPQSIRQAFKHTDMVIVASSTAAYAQQVATAALETGIDYLDLQYSTSKMNALQAMAQQIENAGLCFITEAGFHPGLPAAMVHFAAQHFDHLETANVGSVIKINWADLNFSQSTIEEFVSEFKDFQTLHFEDGQWQKAGMLAMLVPRTMDFGQEFGRQYCMPMFLEEMRLLPEHYTSLRETGFFVGGFNWFVDWLLSPVILAVLKLFPQKGMRPMGKLMRWGLETFSRPPYGTLLKLEAKGTKNKASKTMEITIAHEDGYMLTAIPVAACLLQYLDASIRKPGLWLQAHIVEPKRFIQDMRQMGAAVRVVENGKQEAAISTE